MNSIELSWYIIIGIFATAVDWVTFSISIRWLNIGYQVALIFALTTGALVHYLANKKMTFKCHSRKYGSQISLYILMAAFALPCSLGIMTLFIKFTPVTTLWARILTTGIMVFPNYLLHKYITFNKKIFVQPEITHTI